ncbi:MAG: IS66 family transposase zinc-finger binding domain-containing protein, partial [Pirellulales bacterium]|nr:IS66 family transposase zinc-finger binding domain-containing protein [Pirellulales bacterium]
MTTCLCSAAFSLFAFLQIERREILLDVAESEKTCPCRGQKRREIGRVATERLGFDPARFYVNRYVQLK